MRLKIFTYLVPVILICLQLGLQAQNATIRGKVTDGESGEILLGATVRMFQDGALKGGAYSDLEGTYTIATAPGNYQLIISYVSYINDTLDVAATDGQVTFNETLLFQTLEVRKDLEVVITAKRDQASSVTLYNQKRNSINTIDGVSIDLIKRTGDPDVAAAMQRVTGVTVEGGRYVYVRGLGDRYSRSTLNGAEIPSLDPNRNTVQMDIFPSSLIDNIIVYKNFTPDLRGDFSGGLIDIRTKDFPDKFIFNVSAGFGYNNQASLRDDFLTYEKSNTDWLGYDNGFRDLPSAIANLPYEVPNKVPDLPSSTSPNFQTVVGQIDQASKSFKTPVYFQRGNSFLDQNYQISIGNQFNVFDRPFGFIAALTYRNTYDSYDGGAFGRYKNTSSAANQSSSLFTELELRDENANNSVLWGSLIKLSYKPRSKHKFGFNYMHNQGGESGTRFMQGPIPKDDPNLFFQTRVLSYLERSLDIFQLEGDHAFGEAGNLKMDWIVSTARSRQDEPDLRFFSNDFEPDPTDGTRFYNIRASLYNRPSRYFRSLEETNWDTKLNFTRSFKTKKENTGSIKFGGAFTTRERTFEENRFEYTEGNAITRFNGDSSLYFAPANLGVSINPNGSAATRLFITDATELRNIYDASQDVFAVFGMGEIPFSAKIKMIVGARLETTQATTESRDSRVAKGELDLSDVLPALNFIYQMKENMNMRFGFSRTLARPTFREFAPFASFDFVNDFLLIGNPGLKRTLIDNADIRWEWFPSPSELLSASVFYKNFDNPIERVINPEASSEQTFRNVPSATAYGIEIEFRKTLEFIAPALRNLQLGGNASFIQSEVDIDDRELAFIRSVDPEREDTRPLFGQSPYAVNFELAYIDDLTTGVRASLSYSVFGQRIAAVGGANPDVYEQPRGLLNFSIQKKINKLSLQFRAANLLNPEYNFLQEYRGTDYTYRNYKTGASFSLGVTYSL